ncbi:GEVED domain-containing protein [Thiothrix lacustris]|uniref:GEVED domain-containing protein n=1 Tax=Thiothrix lacustris TaxID=525917 RepID=UPI0027E42476|nr:GEVED domain-containing protein [Thiothrix lacustris]WMP19132.1 GEVED domain-containing protein [Thiothrix lacustris]
MSGFQQRFNTLLQETSLSLYSRGKRTLWFLSQFALVSLMAFTPAMTVFAATPTQEFQTSVGGPTGNGPSIANQSVTMRTNTDNPTGTTFAAATNPVTVTLSLSNFQHSVSTSTISTGRAMDFGMSPSGSVYTGAAIYQTLSGIGSPTDSMFSSLPSTIGQGISTTNNGAIQIHVSSLPLKNAGIATNTRNYYGDLTISFSRPLTNPTLHISGLGGTYSVLGITTELDLDTTANPSVTLSKISGTSNFTVNNTQILNTAINPSASCASSVGACGSVLAKGNSISSLTFKVYLRGDGGESAWGDTTAIAGDSFYFAGVSVLDQYDYSDAPATYGTPLHALGANLYLGATTPDSETAAKPGTTATLDDTTGTDDEDAIASFPILSTSMNTYSLSNIPITNTTGGAATLYGWIDVNRNSRFDGNEVATATVASGATSANLNWSGLTGVTAGASYVRLRLTTQTLANTNSGTLTLLDTRSTATASDGEVEDYALTISTLGTSCSAVPVTTLGNASVTASNEYILTPDLTNQSGFIWSNDKIDLNQAFDIQLGVYLGSNVGTDATTGLDKGADGVSFILQNDSRGTAAQGYTGGFMGVDGDINLADCCGMTDKAVTPSVTVEFDTFDNTFMGFTGDIAKDHTAIYLNGDIALPDPANTLLAATQVGVSGEIEDGKYHLTRYVWNPTTKNLTYYFDGTQIASVTYDLIPYFGSSYVRFGFAGATGSSKNLQKVCWITPPTMSSPSPLDYSDAPVTYGVPSHTIVSGIKLGATAPDSEIAAKPNVAADGDDTTGTDDEDAIASFPTLTSGVTAYSLSNIPVTNTTGSAATLYGWIDVNLNGRFDGNEVATAAVASGATTANLSWSSLTVATAGSSYVRLRLTTQALTNTNSGTLTNLDTRSDGAASDGEVEDYALTIAAAQSYPTNDATVLYCPAVTTDTGYTDYRIAWTYNSPVNTLLPDHTGGNWPNGQFDQTVIASAPAQTIGSGMGYTFDADKQTVIHLSNVDKSDAQSAFSGGDYIEYQFTTQASMNAAQLFNGFAFASHDYTQSYKIALLFSEDNFATATTLLSDYAISPASGGYQWIDKATNGPLYLKPSTTYKFRILFYGASNASAVYWDDFHVSMGLCQDFSDAPIVNYGSTSHNLPRTTTYYLGSAKPDAESGVRDGGDAGLNADGDDTGGSTPDDEDGVTLPTFTQGSAVTMTATVAGTGGYLQGWIDWNGNSVFDAAEKIAVDLTDGGVTDTNPAAGIIGWTVNVPADAVTTPTFARFRWSTTAGLDATTAASDGEIEDYAVTILPTSYDYGDAPADLSAIDVSMAPAYPTLIADNGARHILNGTTFLGAAVTAEAEGKPTVAADGDSDDGVTFPTLGTKAALLVGKSNSMTVTASTTGFLNVWIDINQDGDWDDAGERLFTNQALSAGANSLSYTPAITTPHGDTYLRFRFTSASVASPLPTGNLPDGEVEDYRVAIVAPEPGVCSSGLIKGGFEGLSVESPVGLLVGNGLYGVYQENVVPGWAFIASDPGATTAEANAGTAFDARNAIELWKSGFDGVPSYEGNQHAEINAYVYGNLYQDLQTTPGTVINYQFAHRGRSGVDTIDVLLGAPGATSSVTGGSGFTTGNTAWKVYTGSYTVPAGQYITRFSFQALSSAGGVPSYGNFIDAIEFGFLCNDDYSDAPITGTSPNGSGTNNYGEAKHTVVNNYQLGAAIDEDTTSIANADASGDGSDDDGVTLPALTQGATATITATVTGTGGYLQGWIDWNGDGTFDAGEQVATNIQDNLVGDTNNTAGTITFTINVPANAVTTPTFARFRWSTTLGLNSTAAAPDGEVEDYALTILTPVQMDYGDAPSDLSSTDPALINIYNVLDADGAAKHTINPAVHMGASIDAETDGQPNAAANGDGSDDDGVTFPTFPDGKSVLYVEQANTLTVNVSTAGYLNAWIDWNENGVWDASDKIASDKAVVAGNNTLTITLPNTTTQGSKYARFRFCTTAGQCSSASGLASDGEVEDYKIDYVTLPYNGSCSALLNGDFEQGVTTNDYAWYDENTIPYWGTTPDMPSSNTFAERNSIEIWRNGFLSTPSKSGDFLAEINAHVSGTLYQDVALTPGTTVSWSLWHRGRDGVDSMNVLIGTPDDVQQRLASTEQKLISDDNTQWVFYSGTYQIPAGQYVTRFGFHSAATTGGNVVAGNLVDNIELGVTCRDYGDAPAQYPTNNANNGAYHQLYDTQALYIGSPPDKELEGMPGNTASGDDTSGSDDEDGVSTLPTLTTNDSSYSLSVKVTNTSTQIANLVGWIDFNRNDSFDSNEAATTTVPAGTSNSNVTLSWTGLSGGVVGDSYLRLRLTTDAKVATGNASTSLPSGVAGDGEIEDYLINITPGGFAVSGRVFNDANVNTLDNTEQGIKAVTVVLQDVAAGTCLSTKTGADGSYTFSSVQPAAANNYVLYEAANEKTATPDACPPAANDPNGYLSTTPNSLTVTVSNADVTGQNFGDTKKPTLTLDNETVILPNTSVVYPHIFRSTADGSVAFNLVNEIAEPAGSNWGSTLYLDANCNAKLDSSDTPVTAPLSVSGTEKTCLLVKVIAPANVSAGASHSIQVQSTFTFGDGTVVTATDVQTRTDLTRVASGSATSPLSGAGKLSLEKSVWNTTRNIDGAVALPGETLRYTIHYENIGDGTLDELAVHDSVPAFTTLVGGSLQCVSTPTELSACSPSSSAGSLDWSFTGKLQAGSQGAVAYDVMVE